MAQGANSDQITPEPSSSLPEQPDMTYTLPKGKQEKQYYATVAGAIVSTFFAILSFGLAYKVSTNDTIIHNMDSLLYAQNQLNIQLKETVHILTDQSSKQDSLISKLGNLQDSAGKQLIDLAEQIRRQDKLIGLGVVGNKGIGGQLMIAQMQQEIVLNNRKIDLKSDSIKLTNAYDSIAILRQNMSKGAINLNSYSFFEESGYAATIAYLQRFKQIIDGEMNNRFLFSNDSLFIQWRNMRIWIQDFIISSEFAPDDRVEAGHFRTIREVRNAQQARFHNQYGLFVEINNKKLNRHYLHF